MERIFIAMPSASGSPHYLSSRAFYFTRGDLASCKLTADMQVNVKSALANNFNILWTHALNLKCDYFAMLHDDVIPESNWLTALYDILTLKKLDLLSCCVPIKDENGDTSTAVGRKADAAELDRGTYDVMRRLTVEECDRLGTFTYEKLAKERIMYPQKDHQLLLNTGCWICDLRRPWWRNCYFAQHDTIVEIDGTLMALFEPEDWFFSRQAVFYGAKIAATSQVKCQHVGTNKY